MTKQRRPPFQPVTNEVLKAVTGGGREGRNPTTGESITIKP